MKQIVFLKTNSQTIYEGRISDLPYKEESIKQKSIELFGDDDPCIIHQSYVIKEFTDELLTLLDIENPLDLTKHNITFIDAPYQNLTLEIKK